MKPWIRFLIAAGLSWVYSVTLGLLLVIVLSENHSLKELLLPGVIPAALVGSTVTAIAITPVAIWAVRTGARNLWFYRPVLWITLAAYVVFVLPRGGDYSQLGLFLLAALGLVVLGLIPPRPWNRHAS